MTANDVPDPTANAGAVLLWARGTCALCDEVRPDNETRSAFEDHVGACVAKFVSDGGVGTLTAFVVRQSRLVHDLHRCLRHAYGVPIRGAKTRTVVAAVRELCGGRALPEDVAIAVHGDAIRRILDAAVHDPSCRLRREKVGGRTYFVAKRPRVRIIEDEPDDVRMSGAA